MDATVVTEILWPMDTSARPAPWQKLHTPGTVAARQAAHTLV
jgi:hypothetical protein